MGKEFLLTTSMYILKQRGGLKNKGKNQWLLFYLVPNSQNECKEMHSIQGVELI